MGDNLRVAILATTAYHDVLGLPLTRFEVGRYLIRVDPSVVLPGHREAPQGPWRPRGIASRRPAERGGARNDDGPDSSVDIGVALEALQYEGKLTCLNGFWCLAGREHLVAERIEKHKLAETKWKILQRWGRLLAYVPFVRAVFVSGSLVFHNTREDSDLDILIIAKYGRIWTARALATGFVGLFGRRRHGTKVADRICFNHFLTTRSLTMRYPSLYNAMTYARLIPLLELGVKHAEFLTANGWLDRYLYRVPSPELGSWKTLRRPRASAVIQHCGEWLTSGRVGDWLERKLKALQLKRIQSDPRSFEPDGRVKADDTQLEFHPASPEVQVLNAFCKRIEDLGVDGQLK